MVILAGSSAFVAPFLLHALLPLVSGGEPLRVDAARLVGTLLLAQLVPLCIGLAVRQRFPIAAARLQGPANLVSKVLNLVTVGLILVTQFRMLTAIRPLGFAGMLALLIASLASGWLAGGPDPEGRKAVALATSLRNVGVGLVIATGSFAGTPAVSAALAYGIVEVFGSLVLALWWGRRGWRPVVSVKKRGKSDGTSPRRPPVGTSFTSRRRWPRWSASDGRTHPGRARRGAVPGTGRRSQAADDAG